MDSTCEIKASSPATNLNLHIRFFFLYYLTYHHRSHFPLKLCCGPSPCLLCCGPSMASTLATLATLQAQQLATLPTLATLQGEGEGEGEGAGLASGIHT